VLQRALPIYGTIAILLVVFVIARISYATRMTNSGLIQIHAELEESAQMSGATAGKASAASSCRAGADAALCLAVDRAARVPRAHAAVILSTADTSRSPVVVLEPVAGRRARTGFALAIVS